MKRFSVIFVILLVGIGVMLNSCIQREEFNLSENNPILRFKLSSEEVKTRAAVAAEEESVDEVDSVEEVDTVEQSVSLEQADTVCWSVMAVEGDEDFSEPLYVTMVTEDREAVAADEYVSEDAQTRGAPVSTSSFASTYGSRGFGLFAYVYEPGKWNAETTTSEYIHNRPVQYFSDNSYWALSDASSSKQYYWPGANYNVRFYAYAPISGGYDSDNNFVPDYYKDIIKVPSGAYAGVPKIPVSVSSKNIAASGNNLTTHPDLVIAKTGELPGNNNKEQHLEFKHAMAAINFQVGAMFVKGTIKEIRFCNVLRSGTINLETQAWEIGTDKATITLTKDIAISGEAGQKVLVEDDYFMMLPQEIPSTAKVEIVFIQSSNGKEHTLSTSIGGLQWEMGKLYTYTLTATQPVTDVYTFEVTAPSLTSANYLGNKSTTGTVKSSRTHTNVFGIVTNEAVKWTTEYSTDGQTWTTTRPEFFSSFTAGANGKADGTTDTYKGTIAPITPDDPKNPFGNNIANRPVNSETTNLYTANGNTTANCYVINKAGTYTFPLVYGNAVKNGAKIENAYKNYYDHADQKITSPYIYPDRVDDVKLLWTDAPNLIKSVKLSSASQTMNVAGTAVRYITFTVPKEHLAPGNAVIAVRDADDVIMWSWHIWVTPWNGGSFNVNSNGTAFTFSNTILGYCPARDATWQPRSIYVRFKQSGSGKVSSKYSFSQTGYEIEYSEGNMPYYQWGRKDPLLMFNYVTKNGKSTAGSEKVCFGLGNPKNVTMMVWYNNAYVDYKSVTDGKGYDGYFNISHKVGADNNVTMGESIKNPYTFYARRKVSPPNSTNAGGEYSPEYDWCANFKYNRWDRTNSANVTSNIKGETGATVKTIYDPCPPGWCVPPVGAFYAFTSAGTASEGSKTTMADKDSRTPAFKAKPKGGAEVILPVTGDRNRYYGAPWWNAVGDRNVQLWTATPTTVKKELTSGTYTYTTCAFFVASGAKYFSKLDDSGLAKSSGFAVLPVKE